MEAEEIDKLCADLSIAMKSEIFIDAYNILEKYSKIQGLKDINFNDINEDIVSKICKELMTRIENENYEYFWKLITTNHKELVYLMQFSSKKSDIKYLIENWKSLQLGGYERTLLIKAMDDIEYIKECI